MVEAVVEVFFNGCSSSRVNCHRCSSYKQFSLVGTDGGRRETAPHQPVEGGDRWRDDRAQHQTENHIRRIPASEELHPAPDLEVPQPHREEGHDATRHLGPAADSNQAPEGGGGGRRNGVCSKRHTA